VLTSVSENSDESEVHNLFLFYSSSLQVLNADTKHLSMTDRVWVQCEREVFVFIYDKSYASELESTLVSSGVDRTTTLSSAADVVVPSPG